MRLNVPVALALVIGGAVSLLAFTATRDWEEALETSVFEREAAGHVASLRLGITSTIEVIRSIRAFYDASKEVERTEFRAFVAHELAEEYHAIQALEWIPRVAAADRAAFEEAARADGLAGFGFTEREGQGRMVAAAARAEYFPVYFVEPLAGNEAALGFDLGSNPARLAALEKARDSGETVATGRITLVQETGDQYGFLVFEPIYRKGAPIGTVAERRAALRGFGLGVLRLGNIVTAAILEKHREGVEHFLFDESAPPDEQLLYPKSAALRNRTDVRWLGCVDNRIGIGGRDWLMTECPTGGMAVVGRWQSWTVLITGVALTGVLALYLLLMLRQRVRTERMAEGLRASEERYRGLFDNAHDMIQSVDAEGRFGFVNRAWTEAMGYTLDDLDGINVFDLIAPESKAHCLEVFEEIMAGKPRNNVPVTFVRKDGRTLETEGNIAPQYSAGRIVATQGIFRDVTERKRIQVELIQAAKMATLGEMATGVAHELNQPLNVIRMAAESSAERIEDGELDADYLRGKLERISAQTERAAAIIDHMRIFGRKADEVPRPIDLRDVTRDALGLIGEQIRLCGIEVETNLAEPSRMVSGHPIQLEQVLLNLLANARDAIEANRQGAEQPRKITVKVEDTGPEDKVRLIVEDSGGGIPQDIIARVFEPFFTTKQTGQGTGLGLSISYGIVSDMGGTIEAANAGDGARITITLPVAVEQTSAA